LICATGVCGITLSNQICVRFFLLAAKVEKKKVRWADEPRQQAATEGTLMCTMFNLKKPLTLLLPRVPKITFQISILKYK